MRLMRKFFIASVVLIASMVSASAFAEEYRYSTPGISGYDPVAYLPMANRCEGAVITSPSLTV